MRGGMRQHLGWVTLIAAACAALTACSSAGADPTPTPTASVSVEAPSPAPTLTVDANGRALPGFVTLSAELPPAQAAPAGLLSQTGPGWSLATYRPSVSPVATEEGQTPGSEATVQVVYLTSPEGQRFQLLELDPAKPLVIDSWTAGESVAYVRQCDPLDCDPATPTQLLDLLTGDIGPVDNVPGALPSAMRIGATLPGSVRFWEGTRTGAALESAGSTTNYQESWLAASSSPDGAYLAVVRAHDYSLIVSAGLAVVDAATGRLTDIGALWTEPLQCTPFRWRADNTLDVSCYDPTREEWRVFAVGPGARQMVENRSATATPPEDGPWVQPDFFVSDGVWAGPYTADGATRVGTVTPLVGLARNAGFEPLTVPDAGAGSARVIASVSGWLYVEATQAANPGLTSVWRYDVAADRWNEVAPLPPGGPTRAVPASEDATASGLTSEVVAP